VEKLFTLSRFVKSDTSALTHAEFRVMCAICSHCNKDDITAFPSQQRIANMCNMTQSNVARDIKTLIEKGFLKYLPKIGKNNQYMVLIKGEKHEGRRNSKNTKQTGKIQDKSDDLRVSPILSFGSIDESSESEKINIWS
jgi:DNA-binding MarR family transcriptional regulator